MHSTPQARHTERIWRISLEQIEATVSDFLGPGRVKGNSHELAFSRHVSMYLARHVGGWSCAKISRFYNACHHSTVLAAIRNIEGLRKQDESVDALLDILTSVLSPENSVMFHWGFKTEVMAAHSRYDSGTNVHDTSGSVNEGFVEASLPFL